MQTKKLIVPAGVALILVAACGNGNDSVSAHSTATGSDAAAYQELAAHVRDQATSYRMTMTTPGTATVPDCQRVHDAYDAEVRPRISQMIQMSGPMDGYMAEHGGANVADYACSAATMMYELDQHRGAACAATPGKAIAAV